MTTEVKLPQLGENLTGGDVSDIKVALGDSVTQGQTLLEVEAEKSTVEVPSPLTGTIQQVLVKKGDAIKVGQGLFLLEETAAAKVDGAVKRPLPSKDDGRMKDETIPSDAPAPIPSASPPAAQAAEPVEPPADGRAVPAGPATRRLARELGVDLARVRGTGPGDRVTEEDVKAFVQAVVGKPAAGSPGVAVAVPPLPDFSKWGEVEKRPLDNVRRRTAEQMSLAWSQIPHVTQHDLADITELEAFRKAREGQGPTLTVTAFALKAAAIALREFPQFNASLDQAAGQLILKRYYHIGVAVDTERGLLVPVLRDVNTKSMHALAQELADVAEKARQKKLAPDDLRGGTFTITNLGGIGGTGFTPIINYPEVAILGLSRGRLQPTVKGDAVVPRLLLPLSLSYDHRVIDGAAAARFVRRVAEMLEMPLVMLLDA
jgi:pyruvate dehydrogenase E2 component (dihydrolipoamide acetyltransferase)